MKIQDLRKKIIINFSASGVLLLICGSIAGYNIYEKSSVESKVQKIKSEAFRIIDEATELERKTVEARKYKELWGKLTANKKNTNGIKMDEINAKLTSIAETYSITNPTIKVTLPEVIKDGILKRSTVNTLFATVNLDFQAVSDVRALAFANDFMESLPGYRIITNFEIKKDKDYSVEDLISISSGKGSGVVKGKIDFFWYVYKELDVVVKKPEEVKSGDVKPAEVKAGEGKPEAPKADAASGGVDAKTP